MVQAQPVVSFLTGVVQCMIFSWSSSTDTFELIRQCVDRQVQVSNKPIRRGVGGMAELFVRHFVFFFKQFSELVNIVYSSVFFRVGEHFF